MNKPKKIYKKLRTLAPKITTVNRWVSWRQNEYKNSQQLILHSLKKIVIKSLWLDQDLNNNKELFNIFMSKLHYKMWELNKKASSSRSRNYCHYIGRSRGIIKKLYMARHTLRRFARFGALPGLIHERS